MKTSRLLKTIIGAPPMKLDYVTVKCARSAREKEDEDQGWSHGNPHVRPGLKIRFYVIAHE